MQEDFNSYIFKAINPSMTYAIYVTALQYATLYVKT